jgi:hypothetical protein
MSLVITSAPGNEEAGFGYYRRLASDNGFSSWRDLTDTAGVDRNRRQLLMRTDEVAKNLGLEPAWAEQAKQKELVCQSWGTLYRTQTDAVCPECLNESLHLRHSWGHAYATACPKHQIQLIDRCNVCGLALSGERLHIGLCSCGHNLANLPRLPATHAQQWLSTLIANNGLHSGEIAPVLHSVDITRLAKIVQILCLYADPTRPKLQRVAHAPKSVVEAIKFLAPIETLLTGWPMGFKTHVEQRIAAGRKDARTLNTLLGDWYIRLRKLALGTAFEEFIQIVIDAAAEKTECVLGLDSAKVIAESTTGYMHAPEAARAIGISLSRLHESIQANECAHRAKRTGTRGQLYEVPNGEVERIQQARAKWISDAEASDMAEITPSVLERMKSAGVVQSDARWREDLLKAGPVNQQSLADLFENVSRLANPTTMVDDITVSWAEFTSRRMGENQAIESLMQAIVRGDIRAVSHAKNLGRLLFRRSDVSRYFGMPLIEAGMTIQQLDKATGWKWECIAHWIDEGLLSSEVVQRRGQSCRIVLPHQLLEFRQKYLPLADLARAMGSKSSAVARLNRHIEFVGAKTLPLGVTRGGLIRIADLGHLALMAATAKDELIIANEALLAMEGHRNPEHPW